MLNDPEWVEQNLGPDDYWYYPGLYAPRVFDDLILVRLVRTALYNEDRVRLKGPIDDEHPNGGAYRVDDERFQVSGRVLIQFAREVEADGRTPVVVFFGQKAEVVTARHKEPKEYAPLLAWLEEEHIATIDVTDDLARDANRNGVDPLFARGGHYSGRGNDVIGRALAGSLPERVAPTCR
jgi:hypothetical protein